MKRKIFFTALIIACLGWTNAFAQEETGVENLPTFEIEDPAILENSFIQVRSEADFFWGKFVLPFDKTTQPDARVEIPSNWNNYPLSEEAHNVTKTGLGSGTYRLRITNLYPNTRYSFPTYKLAYTAFKIYAGPSMIYESGTPSAKWEKTESDQMFEAATFTSDKNGEVVLTFCISNSYYRKGGLRGTISLYEENSYKKQRIKDICTYSIFSGMLLIITIYCLLLFLLKKEKTPLYLAIMVLSILSRIDFSTFPLIKYLLPGIPQALMFKIEFIAVFLIPSAITLYIDSLNKSVFRWIPAKIVAAPGLILLVLDFVCPIGISNRLVPIMQGYMFFVIFWDALMFIISFIKKRTFEIGISFISLAIVAIGASSDIFFIENIPLLKGWDFLTPSLVIFALCHIILLAFIQNRNYEKVIELNNNLIETNKAYYRFVPQEFLELLSKKDITEVTLGEYKISKAAILSADIRNFTSTSEKLQPVQVFDMLNTYLHKVAPLIRKYNGIIEKFLGDGIIAIFPDSSEAALNCAIEMQEQMIELREEFIQKGIPPIKIGIGVHYGNIIIGTGGNDDRMTEISLSDDIDIAVKTESQTKVYHHPILATYQAIRRAANEARLNGEKFGFCGEKILNNTETGINTSTSANAGGPLFSIYNQKIGNVL